MVIEKKIIIRALPAPQDLGKDFQIEPPPPVESHSVTDQIDPGNEKAGATLESVDWLFIRETDRRTFLPLLEQEYGIKFSEGGVDPTLAISFTSQKCVISDLTGQKYFLKRKPSYSLGEPQRSRSALMQSRLSECLSYIPKVIYTKKGSPYARIGEHFFLLTPYIEGDFFMGRLSQSVACASVLGEIHRTASEILPPEDNAFIDSTEETLRFIEMVGRLDFPSVDLKEIVLKEMRELALKYQATNIGKRGWLHGDFSPFNMIFRGNQVIAVNDFDNVAYGLLARDVAECLLTHSGVNYAGATSSLRAPIRTTIDISRMKRMLNAYLKSNPISKDELIDLPNQMCLIWLELMALGLLRGDFSLNDVQIALPHCHNIQNEAKKLLNMSV